MAEIFLANKKQELEKFLNSVAETILQGNMSLFLGAGSSMQYGAPNWDTLINTVFKGLKGGSNIDKAQLAELKGIDIKTEVAKQTSFIKFDSRKRNTYLNHLLNFDYKSIWTSNYDNIIEKILEQKFKSYKSIYKYSHFQELSYPGGCFLFKINGSHSDPKTIVVTKEDFIDYHRSHEAYLILLKRELLCHSFLFLGCSFDDNILRICIKDILNCIENSSENFATDHFAVIAEKNKERMDFISKDLAQHYNIKCLNVTNIEQSYLIAYGISCKVKYNSIFVSGAKKYERHSAEENIGKQVCQNLIESFMKITDFPFKFISGMGMSIGHFICGTVKQKCINKNINRYLQMEPFPFTSAEDNQRHRENMLNKAGIYIFIFGDIEEASGRIENNGMWKEYIQAKSDKNNIIIPLPCGKDSISKRIFENEKIEFGTFSAEYCNLLEKFDYQTAKLSFFDELVEKVILITRKKIDDVIDDILLKLSTKL